MRPALAGTAPTGNAPNAPTGTLPTGTLGARSGGSGMGNASADSALVSYLVANRGSAPWIVAATSAQEAGPLELATSLPVMAMGGFTGPTRHPRSTS